MWIKKIVLNCFLPGLMVWIAAGCATPTDPDDNNGGNNNGQDDCEMDDSQIGSTDADWMLESGQDAPLGYVCPKGDVDHYWFLLTEQRSIVTVQLKNNVSMSDVDYCYDLFFESHADQVGSGCDFDGSDGVTQIKGTHYLEEVGTYFLEVRDASLDDYDTRNPYLVSMQTQQDPDSNEPNNEWDQATPLVPQQPVQGNISFLEDEDWFELSGVSAGQLVEVELSTQASSPVDLHYTLFLADGQTPVNEGQDSNGQDGATYLKDLLPFKQDGTYYLRITDVQDNDSDLEVAYTLQVRVYNDPDVQDATPPFNNSWENAEDLVSDVAVTARAISYRGDEDWYKITSPGVTDADPALLEIDLQYAGDKLDPLVELIVADPNNDCSPGDPCDLLDIACAGGCDTVECANARCPSHECFVQMNRCRGAGMCLPRGSGGNGCGISTLVMRGAEWSETGDARHLHTVAPMQGETYYLRVSDFQSDNYDMDASYSLKATVRAELDDNEPNGLYNPYLTSDQEEDTRGWNRQLATDITCTTLPATITTPEEITEINCSMTGLLSFRGDQDWYRLVVPYDDPNTPEVDEADFFIPQVAEADPETMGDNVDWNIEFVWNYAGRKSMETGIALYGGWQQMGFTAEEGEQSGTWGNGSGQCSYFCGEYQAPVSQGFLWVFTPDFKGYDYDTAYTITIRATPGCPGNCSYCSAGCTSYCCPNPNNPNPE